MVQEYSENVTGVLTDIASTKEAKFVMAYICDNGDIGILKHGCSVPDLHALAGVINDEAVIATVAANKAMIEEMAEDMENEEYT